MGESGALLSRCDSWAHLWGQPQLPVHLSKPQKAFSAGLSLTWPQQLS